MNEREELIMQTVRFVLIHQETIDGKLPFTLTAVDPDKWWAQMQLLPTPALLPRSAQHLEARVARWQQLAIEAMT